MKTWNAPFDDVGLKTQSTRQCPVTVNISVSLRPLPCHVFVTAQTFPASGADASCTSGGALLATLTGESTAADNPAGRLWLAHRLNVPTSARTAATTRPVRVCRACRFHQAMNTFAQVFAQAIAIGTAGFCSQRCMRIVSSRRGGSRRTGSVVVVIGV